MAGVIAQAMLDQGRALGAVLVDVVADIDAADRGDIDLVAGEGDG
jgi:hypothetical protein